MNIKTQEKTQFDLFEQGQSVDKKIRKKTRFLLPDVKNSITVSYETMIFTMIGFLMVCIAAFALGVEKGRHDQRKSEPNLQSPALSQERAGQSKFDLEAPLSNSTNRRIVGAEGLKKGASNVATSKPKNIKLR